MRNFMLLTGVAALAASMPAIAKDNDRGRGNGRDQAQAQHKGKNHARAERGRERRAERGQERRVERRQQERRADRREQRSERLDRRERRVERAIQQERREIRQARSQDRRIDRRQEALREAREQQQRLAERRQRLIRESRREDRRDWRRWTERRLALRDRFADDFRRWRGNRPRRIGFNRRFCPPGLARQNRWCLPPGQLRHARIGQRLPVARVRYNIPDRYRYRFVDGDRWFWRYDNSGYVYRIDNRTMVVNRIVPLYGSDLIVGQPMPIGYDIYNVPYAYRGYYPDTADYYYRYDDGAIYRVDPETRLVEGVVAMLTGGVGGLGGLGIGDPLPLGYDAYNVPYAYRDSYYDRPDAWYRYADGSIYQVDPETRLIEAVISTLV